MTSWTEDMDDTLRKLRAEGMSNTAIGERLGLSKGAINGRCFRLKLPGRPNTGRPKGKRHSTSQAETFRAPIGQAADTRRPGVHLPGEAEIESFIARHGVTRCPLAAVGVTTGIISAEDRAAIAAHQKAREDAFWESGRGAGLLKFGHRGGSVRAKRGRS